MSRFHRPAGCRPGPLDADLPTAISEAVFDSTEQAADSSLDIWIALASREPHFDTLLRTLVHRFRWGNSCTTAWVIVGMRCRSADFCGLQGGRRGRGDAAKGCCGAAPCLCAAGARAGAPGFVADHRSCTGVYSPGILTMHESWPASRELSVTLPPGGACSGPCPCFPAVDILHCRRKRSAPAGRGREWWLLCVIYGSEPQLDTDHSPRAETSPSQIAGRPRV